MKKSLLLLTCCALILNSCKEPVCGCAPPLLTSLQGQWKWVKTGTPSYIITSEQAGYTNEINFPNDSIGFYVTFYRADSLLSKLIIGVDGHNENKKESSIVVRFNPKGYMKFILKGNKMETSEFMNEYSAASDTIRHYYQYKGEARK